MDLPNWWNVSVGVKSIQSWLPTAIDSYDLDMSYSRQFAQSLTAKSWLSVKNIYLSTKQLMKAKLMNYKKTSYQSLMYLSQGEMVKEQGILKKREGYYWKKKKKKKINKNNKEEINSGIKIRLYPNESQKEKLREMFGVHRYLYNKIIKLSKDDIFSLNKKQFNDKYKKYTVKKSMVEPDYIMNKPEEVFDSTHCDIIKAVEAKKAQSRSQKDKTGKGFNYNTPFKYKSRKKDFSTSIEIRTRSIKFINNEQKENNKIRIWPTYFGFKNKNDGIIIKSKIPELSYSCKLILTKNNKYYLAIPSNKEFKNDNNNNVCAIDPGVRSMITIYDPRGVCYEFGSNIYKMIYKAKKIDKIKSKIRKFQGPRNKRYRLKKEQRNIQDKIKNCINNIHHKITKYLSDNYNQILLPEFQTKQMTNKKTRKISKSTVRNMYLWSHYKFRKLLDFKMNRKNKKLILCTEEYTSKTCTNCGIINHNLGSNKVYSCNNCNLTINRDVNGARNIYIKNHHLVGGEVKPTPQAFTA